MNRTDDQRSLGGAVADLADKHVGRLREVLESPLGYAPDLWADIAAMGLPGIAVEERYGGGGGGVDDLAVAVEELGRRLLPSPLFGTAVLAAPLLAACADEAARARWLPRIAAGELRATAAQPEHTHVDVAGSRLTGTVRHVVDGGCADLVLVPADTGFFAVEPGELGDEAGVRRVETDTPLDPTRRTATIHLDSVPATPVPADAEALRSAWDTARVLLATEQVSGAQRCLDMAVAYATGRVQFGRPIGAFQAIKHLCADIYSDIACARALVRDALASRDRVAVAAASATASEAFVRAAERNAQIHGGISYTWEHDCHLYLRRARAAERLLGTVRDSYDEVARALPLQVGP